MLTAEQLIAYFRRMLEEKWDYNWGSSSTEMVDCAGAFVWAFRQHDMSIYHGSNRIQRTELLEMLPVDKWQPGMAAFKCRRPSDAKYALPQGYLPGGAYYNGDLNDYYHIGLVDYDGNVLNAQGSSTGFVKSKLSDNWCGVGYLKQVVYALSPDSAYVETPDGNPVKLRKSPSTDEPYLDKIPNGSNVTVLRKITKKGTEWAHVQVAGQEGYVMSEFLKQGSDDETVTIKLPKETAQELLAAITEATGGDTDADVEAHR